MTMLFLALIFAVIVAVVWGSVANGISPMPTSPKVKAALFKVLPKVEGTIIDLGSGWGTLLTPLAKAYPHSKIIGYETSWVPYLVSKLRKRPNLSIIRRDLFSISLENATMVICYLYPGAMKRLQTKLDRELKKGTWVVSHTFALPGWKPLKVVEVNDLYRTKIYLYQKG